MMDVEEVVIGGK